VPVIERIIVQPCCGNSVMASACWRACRPCGPSLFAPTRRGSHDAHRARAFKPDLGFRLSGVLLLRPVAAMQDIPEHACAMW